MGRVTIGLKSIGFADIAADGGPGTVFVTKFNTSTDSLTFNQDEPGEKTVDVEESDDPLYIRKTKGRKSVTCNIADMDVDLLAYLEGGVVTTGVGGEKTYAEPDTYTPVYKTVKIEPEEGLTRIINRALLTVTDTGALGKNNEKLYTLTIDPVKPEKTGVATQNMIQPGTGV